jgi:hypothetical protein
MTPFHIAESGLTKDNDISLLCASDPLTGISLSLSFEQHEISDFTPRGYFEKK